MPGVTRQTTITGVNGNTDTLVQYNGYYFPSAITTKLSAKPIHTDSGRTVKRIDHTLMVEFVLCIDDFVYPNPVQYAGSNLDTLGTTLTTSNGYTMDFVYSELKRILLEKGKVFSVNGLGCGRIFIAPGFSNGLQTDINNGPTPIQCDITRFDAARTLHVVWSIQFSLSPCQENQLIEGVKVNEFDFSVHYTVDNSGMMVRNVYGNVGFPNYVSRGFTKFNPETVIQGRKETIKEMILKTFPIPAGFERRADFTTDPSRTKIQFSITDSEIPCDDAYFPGTVRISATHTVNNSTAMSNRTKSTQAHQFDVTIAGTIEVAPGRTKYWGWNAFVNIVRSRVRFGSRPYYMAFLGITDDIYSRRFTFNLRYQTTFNPNKILEESALFAGMREYPSPTSDDSNRPTWDAHNAERQRYLGPFGYDGKQIFKPGAELDRVVNLCDPTPPEIPTKQKEKPKDDKFQSKNDPTSTLGTNVTEAASFIHYRNEARVVSNFNVAVHGVIGKSDSGLTKDTVNNGATDLPATYVSKGLIESNRPKTTANIQQVRGTGTHYVVLEGEAARVGYRIAIPKIQSIEGVKGEPQFISEELSPSALLGWTADNIPIYGASWRRVYCLPQLGAKVQIAAVPVQYMTNDAAYSIPTKSSGNQNSVLRNG